MSNLELDIKWVAIGIYFVLLLIIASRETWKVFRSQSTNNRILIVLCVILVIVWGVQYARQAASYASFYHTAEGYKRRLLNAEIRAKCGPRYDTSFTYVFDYSSLEECY